MASIKWSALVSEVKGKLNGTIFSNSSQGATMRNRRSGGGVVSSRWQVAKSNLSFISSIWRTLTPLEVGSFETQRVNYRYINKFGDSVIPSAFQLFNTLNSNLRIVSGSVLRLAIAPNPEISVSPASLLEVTESELYFDYIYPQSANYFILLYSSPPVSNGVKSVPQRKVLLFPSRGDSPAHINLIPFLLDVWGQLSNGQKLFFTYEIIDARTGQRYGKNVLNITLTEQ